MNPEDLKHALAGPIASIPTFFTRDGSQDLDSVRQTVEFAVTHRIDRRLLTAGDSNYDLQSEAELRALAAAVIEQAAGRATVIVGTALPWWRDQIVDFARDVEQMGADAVMILRPQVSLGDSPHFEAPVEELYAAVSEVVSCGIVLNGRFSMTLLRRLAQIPNVVALKEDAGDAWCHDALWTVGRELAVFGGGQKWRFLYGSFWGMVGYISSYSLWAPQVTDEFWRAVKAGDTTAAAAIVDRYDNPFFEFAIGHPKGYHPVQQAAMEVFGRGSRWLRPPQPSLDDCEVDELRAVFERVGLHRSFDG